MIVLKAYYYERLQTSQSVIHMSGTGFSIQASRWLNANEVIMLISYDDFRHPRV